MLGGLRLGYSAVKNAQNEVLLRPLLPLTLNYQGKSVEISGLVDTGADVNVLPYSVGITLGAEWDKQNIVVQLSGNLAMQPAKGILLTAHIGTFAPVKLAFAWTQHDNLPLILGQVNFLAEFHVCFYRSQNIFEVNTKDTRPS